MGSKRKNDYDAYFDAIGIEGGLTPISILQNKILKLGFYRVFNGNVKEVQIDINDLINYACDFDKEVKKSTGGEQKSECKKEKAKILSHEVYIAELEAENNRARLENGRARLESEQLKTEAIFLKDQLKSCTDLQLKYEEENEVYKSEVEKLKNELKKYSSDEGAYIKEKKKESEITRELESQLAKLRNALEDKTKMNKQLEMKFKGKESELEEEKMRNDELIIKINDLSDENKKITTQNIKLKTENGSLTNDNIRWEHEYDEQLIIVMKKDQMIEELQEDNKKLEQDIITLNGELRSYQDVIDESNIQKDTEMKFHLMFLESSEMVIKDLVDYGSNLQKIYESRFIELASLYKKDVLTTKSLNSQNDKIVQWFVEFQKLSDYILQMSTQIPLRESLLFVPGALMKFLGYIVSNVIYMISIMDILKSEKNATKEFFDQVEKNEISRLELMNIFITEEAVKNISNQYEKIDNQVVLNTFLKRVDWIKEGEITGGKSKFQFQMKKQSETIKNFLH